MNQELITFDTELKRVISPEMAWTYRVVPQSESGDTVSLYIDESANVQAAKEELEIILGKTIQLVPTNSGAIENTLYKEFRQSDPTGSSSAQKLNLEQSDVLHEILQDAHGLGSSDIHIEIYEFSCRIRVRVDGKLMERHVIETTEYPAFINKIKIQANLDIAEKRLPQDGRMYFTLNDNQIDIRVSTLPTLYGEKVVLRLLNKETANLDIQKLGFDESQLSVYHENIKKPHGIILISGPTGSGKTTTLYATLKILNQDTVNVLTIEDPIEYTLDGINQVQLKPSIGLDYASALRTFLRQDPDIIMLGEIRDAETAQMAIRAALTGHLVLSTIHTNSALGTISRLMDMDIPEFLVKATLNMSIAQRLVRKLCPDCKRSVPFKKDMLPSSYVAPESITEVYEPVGCDQCYFTGYKGRRAVYEMINMDDETRNNLDFSDLENSIQDLDKAYKTLADIAFDMLKKGETSLDEVFPILTTS